MTSPRKMAQVHRDTQQREELQCDPEGKAMRKNGSWRRATRRDTGCNPVAKNSGNADTNHRTMDEWKGTKGRKTGTTRNGPRNGGTTTRTAASTECFKTGLLFPIVATLTRHHLPLQNNCWSSSWVWELLLVLSVYPSHSNDPIAMSN